MLSVGADISTLQRVTASFFHSHWSTENLGPAPEWTLWETFLFGSVPNHKESGCYAIFFNTGLAYVGLGASRGDQRYPQHGVSRRLMAHVIRSDRQRGVHWSKLTETWAEATAIYTIGFSRADYLAASLETYLIRELSPPRNGRV
jgi:hypothetical protein